MAKRLGHTLILENTPSVLSFGAVGSKKESEGPLARYFDQLCPDSTMGEQTWEKAECRLQKDAINIALNKAGLSPGELQYIFAGDLLNQCTSSTYGLRDLGVPFVGLYGACSTMAESLALASLFVEGGFGERTAAITSSHFCSAERQFRFPLEYGGQRTPTSQWTVTGSGAAIVGQKSVPPYVRGVTIGTIKDMGITDANNMGAAMAPAAHATLTAHFQDTGRSPSSYDMIFTGDLGVLGSELLMELLKKDGIQMNNHADCGSMLFNVKNQDVHCGGSGCGCCASVLTGHILNNMKAGKWKNILFCPTGALHSPTSAFQGESIPGICHAIAISTTK